MWGNHGGLLPEPLPAFSLLCQGFDSLLHGALHIFDRVERSAAPHLRLQPSTTSQADNRTLLAYLPASCDIPLLAPNPLESTGAFPQLPPFLLQTHIAPTMEDKSKPPSTRTSVSSSESEDPLAQFASVLAHVKPAAVTSLAVGVRRRERLNDQNQEYTCAVREPPNCGSFNLLYTLEFNDGIKWILRIPAPGENGLFNTPSSTRELRSEVMAMRLLRSKIPLIIPEIFDFSETSKNELGVPYILMSFMEGFPVSKMWWDENGPTPRQQRRERILDNVAEAMAELHAFQFEKIGTLQYQQEVSDLDEPEIGGIGPFNVVDEVADLAPFNGDDAGVAHSLELGPFGSSREFFEASLDQQKPPQDEFSKGLHVLLRMMIRSLPRSLATPTAEKETFVLAHPDFDSQNVLVTEDGTLTALLDWDNIHTVPRFVGYQLYPGWITRDWDPIMYGYGIDDCRSENSPEELDEFRERYARSMKSLLQAAETDYSEKSHLYEAVWIAAESTVCCDHIVQKIFRTLWPEDMQDGLREEERVYFYETAVALGEGTLGRNKEERIQLAFKYFFACDTV